MNPLLLKAVLALVLAYQMVARDDTKRLVQLSEERERLENENPGLRDEGIKAQLDAVVQNATEQHPDTATALDKEPEISENPLRLTPGARELRAREFENRSLASTPPKPAPPAGSEGAQPPATPPPAAATGSTAGQTQTQAAKVAENAPAGATLPPDQRPPGTSGDLGTQGGEAPGVQVKNLTPDNANQTGGADKAPAGAPLGASAASQPAVSQSASEAHAAERQQSQPQGEGQEGTREASTKVSDK